MAPPGSVLRFVAVRVAADVPDYRQLPRFGRDFFMASTMSPASAKTSSAQLRLDRLLGGPSTDRRTNEPQNSGVGVAVR
jgi:hypothetical protein